MASFSMQLSTVLISSTSTMIRTQDLSQEITPPEERNRWDYYDGVHFRMSR